MLCEVIERFSTACGYWAPAIGIDELGHPSPTAWTADAVCMSDFDVKFGAFCGFDQNDLREYKQFRQIACIFLKTGKIRVTR